MGDAASGHIDRNLGHDHPWSIALAYSASRLSGGLLLETNLLLPLLVLQDLLLVLLEADEVEVEIFDTVLLEQILSNETAQVDASLGQGIVFVQRGVTLDSAKVASVVTHIQ